MLRKAVTGDLKNIMDIIGQTIKEMRTYGNIQWDEDYPQEKDFMSDIKNGDLFVAERDKKLAGFICINEVEPKQYDELKWALSEKFIVLHRMAVSPKYRRSGVGTELMKFADEYAIKNRIRYLKTDTYSINTKMNALIKKCSYSFVGKIRFPGRDKSFYCYEKVLNV